MSVELSSRLESELEQVVKTDVEIWSTLNSSEFNAAGQLLNKRAAEEAEDEDAYFEADYWQRLLHELFDLLCTDSTRYEAERERLKHAEDATTKFLVPSIAAAVANAVGLASGLLIPFVALVLFGVIKISKNAWCDLKAEVLGLALNDALKDQASDSADSKK